MASEPTPMKKPDDENAEREDLFAEELDDIDLDALLEDDEEVDLLKDDPLARQEKGPEAPVRAIPEDDALSEGLEVIEDAEIDLLADDDEGALPGASSSVADLGLAGDENEPVRVDGSTNGRPAAGEPEDLLGVEEEPVFDLLADDEAPGEEPVVTSQAARPEPEMDLLAEDPAEAALPPPADEEDRTARGVREEAPSAQETVALTPPPGKKPGRFAGVKGKFGGKGKGAPKAAARATPAEEPEEAEAKPAKPAKPAKEKARKEKAAVAASAEPVVARPAKSTVPFVCSECYEEFLIPASYAQEMVSCPECLHVGKRPDADFLRTIHVHKSGEKKSFALAMGVGAVLLVLLLALMWTISPYGPGTSGDSTIPMVLLGASALLTLAFIWLIVRFEGNRWEVYF